MQQIGEGTLAIPPEWHNATVNIYTAQPPGARGVSVTVNRDRLPFGSSLHDYIEAQSKKLKGQLKDYQLLHQEQITLGQHPAYLFEFTWQSQDAGAVHQFLMTVADEQKVLNFAGTSAGKMSDSVRQQILAMLHSFRLTPSTPA